MEVLNDIISKQKRGEKQLAVLLDPEKLSLQSLPQTADAINEGDIRLVLVGGSGYQHNIDDFIVRLRQLVAAKVVLFPGNLMQFSKEADALLFLSLMNSNDSDWLVGQHIRIAREIKSSGIEVIPMGYILVDGGRESAVERVTHALPLREENEIVAVAVAAELLGKCLVYLEAGSGALQPVKESVIRSVRESVAVPLIVGGGIHSVEEMNAAFRAGADIVVIGNYFEQHPEEIVRFGKSIRCQP